MSANAEQRKLAAIMFTDMVGYSALSQRDDKLALELLEEHRELLRKIFPEFNGTEIKTIGDAFLVEFNSALEAAQCAIEIQRTLAKRNADAPADRQIELKIGIHIGDVVHRGGDVYGDGVNIASRIEPLAGAGGICVSMDVERQIRNAVETRFEKLAPTELKNISVPMELFRIVLPWERHAPSKPAAKKDVSGERRAIPLARLGAAVLLVAVIGTGLLVFQLLRPKAPSTPQISNASRTETATTVPEKSVAVLPFENLSEDKANAYFADGIQDEILTKLASVADLKVISRTSTAKYKSKPEDLKTVSQQLGVANVVEGTVQRAADKVRVNVQLIDARADSHLWAKTFDREIKDVFAVESEVSQEIADALQAKLSPNESNALATAPTKDPEAYDLFLKGEYEEREAENSLKAEPFDRAASFYREALDRDPNFALATARLAENRMLRHWFVTRLSESELAEVKTIADRALTLAPDLGAAHIAFGSFYYYGQARYDEALKEFQHALELQPNNSHALELTAYIHRRQGQWRLSISELAKCEVRDPQNASLLANIGSNYLYLRMWPEAKRAGLRALALDSHNLLAMRTVVICCLNGVGDRYEAKRAAAHFLPGARITNFVTLDVSATQLYLYSVERDFASALKICAIESANPDEERSRLTARAVIHLLAGDTTEARSEIDKARSLLEARLRERPNDEFANVQLSWINVALNRNTEALRLIHHAIEVLPPDKDALSGPTILTALAEIQARANEPREALKTIQSLLTMPAGFSLSIAQLRINPVWDPIRHDPGFQQLLAGKELVGPNK
jgi:adenylate cyclase